MIIIVLTFMVLICKVTAPSLPLKLLWASFCKHVAAISELKPIWLM